MTHHNGLNFGLDLKVGMISKGMLQVDVKKQAASMQLHTVMGKKYRQCFIIEKSDWSI